MITENKSGTFYFWCCLLQSVVIIGLAFYAGKEKADKELLVKEKQMVDFALTIRETEVSRLKAIIDTCYGEKK